MIILNKEIHIDELKKILGNYFDDMIKGVVDIKREVLAIDAPMHADEEAALISEGSKQDDLWGINIYPLRDKDNFLHFESLINIKPHLGNLSINIQSNEIRDKIIQIINKKIIL